MKLSEEMKNKTLLSFELFPPKTEKGLQNAPLIFCQLNPLSPVIQHTTSRIEHGTAVLEEIRFSGKFVGAAEHRLDFGGQDT